MENLGVAVIIKNDQIVVSSRQIAENFEKRHDHVIRDIESMKKDVPNFGEVFYESTAPDSYGRDQKIYLMNRDGFSLLAMGFTGQKALQWKLKYIQAFNEMEQKLAVNPFQIPKTLSQALHLAATLQEKIGSSLEKVAIRKWN